MRLPALLCLATLLCASCGSDALPGKGSSAWVKSLLRSSTASPHNASPPDAQRVLRDVNRYRRQHGLRSLRYSATCQAAANIQANYNASQDEYGHDNPTYASVRERLRAAKHHFAKGTSFWGENALRYTLNRDPSHSAAWHVFHRYHESPHHDKEMLNPNFTKFGTASVLDAEGHLYNIEVYAN